MNLSQKTTCHRSLAWKCQKEEALGANTSYTESHDVSLVSPAAEGSCAGEPETSTRRHLLSPLQQASPPWGHSWWAISPWDPMRPQGTSRSMAWQPGRLCSPSMVKRHCFFSDTFIYRTQFHTRSWSWQKQHGKFQPEDSVLENSQHQISKRVRKGTLWISSQFQVHPPKNLLMSWAH